MVKRRRAANDDLIDLSSTDQNSEHHSCFQHIEARLRDIDIMLPCFSADIPRRERSRRRVKCKSLTPRQKKKLNTAEFQCYLENIWKSFPHGKTISITYLDCLWFALYMKASLKAKVLKWIKKKQIFTKKYVLVPIICWNHWSLLIFCNFGEDLLSKTSPPCMLLLDSLEMANPKRVEPNIRKFVLDIFKMEGRSDNKAMISQIPLLVPKVPQQRDGEECGDFVLYYMNMFVENAPDNISIEGCTSFIKQDWFTPEGLEHFFEKLDYLDK